jgi:hypothetical protein
MICFCNGGEAASRRLQPWSTRRKVEWAALVPQRIQLSRFSAHA